MRRPFWFGWLAATIAGGFATAAERPECERVVGARFELEGPAGDYVRNVTAGWLLPAPGANPAILAMYRDRDRKPLRDLLPWSGEFAGKYVTGAAGVARLGGDAALKEHLGKFVRDWIALQDDDGYLGPFPSESHLTGQSANIAGKPGGTWDAWGHYHAMIGLLAWHDLSGDPAARGAATKIGDLLCDKFLGDKRPRLVDTGSTEMNLAPAHGLALLYRLTGDDRHLALSKQIVDEFAAVDAAGKPLAGDYLNQGLAGKPFFATPKPRWESLHPMLALAELARITGEDKYKTAFENLWWSIAETDRHNSGGFSSGEQAQGNPYHPGAIETCCTIAWMALSVDMLGMTADPIVADELELSTLNSGLGIFSPTGRWSTYDTPMDGVRKANYHEIGFQCRPGSPELNCCSVNAARGLGLIGEWGLMRDAGGLLLNWYGPGSMVAPLDSATSVTLRQRTDYPRSGAIRIEVAPSRPARFALKLRIPHWSARTKATINGEPVADVTPGRYLALSREWRAGDAIELQLDFTPRIWAGERERQGFASIYRGPILLAFDPRFNPEIPTEFPPIDAGSLRDVPVPSGVAPPSPIVLVEAPTADGKAVRLCDFASAGADGSPYRSWLRIGHQPTPTPFRRANPLRTAPAPAPGG